MDIDGGIAGLGERFTADEAVIAARMLRENGGTGAGSATDRGDRVFDCGAPTSTAIE